MYLSKTCLIDSFGNNATKDKVVEITANMQNWLDDDNMCHHHILESLCNVLFNQYVKKKKKMSGYLGRLKDYLSWRRI